MQRKFLAATISAALFAISTSGYANVDLTDSSTVQTLLSTVPGGGNGSVGGDIGGSGTNCTLSAYAPFGFSIGSGTSKYVVVTLTNATFANQVALDSAASAVIAGTAAAPATAVANSTVTLSSGGNPGDDSVVFEVAAGATAIQPSDVLFLDFNAPGTTANNLTLDITGDVSIKVEMFSNTGDALAGTNPLPGGVSGSFLTFAGGLDTSINDASSLYIDPADDKKFSDTTDLHTKLSEIKVQATAGVCDAAGAEITSTSLFATQELVVSGNFKGATSVYLTDSGTPCAATAPTAGTTPALPAIGNVDTDAVTATFSGLTTIGNPGTSGANLCIIFDSTTSKTAGSYTCTSTATGGPLDGTKLFAGEACGDLQFAGSSDRINWGQNPNNKYKQYFRISNPSSIGGGVTVTLVNNAGESTSFPLGDVAGNTTELAAGASTDPISIDALVAAAPAPFDLNGGKVRVIVRGDFGDNAKLEGSNGGDTILGDVNTETGIVIEAVGLNPANDTAVMME